MGWLPLVVCHSISACLGSQNTGMMTVIFFSLLTFDSVYSHLQYNNR